MHCLIRRCVTALALVPLLGAVAFAAPAPAPAPAGQPASAPGAPAKRFSLAVNNEVARTTLARVGELTGELVLADSTVRGALTADWKDVTAEEALADACKQLNVSWKRVYLPPGTWQIPDNVSQIYRNLRNLQAGGLIALDPATGKGTMLVMNATLPKDLATVMEQPNSAFRRGYLVLNERVPLIPQATGDDTTPWLPGQPLTPGKLGRLQRDMFAALSQMTPEERQAALQASMAAQMEVITQNPQLLAQIVRESAGMQMQFLVQNQDVMRDVMQAAMQSQIEALQQMTPEQRQSLMKVQLDLVKAIPPQQMQQLMELMKGAQ